MELSEMANAITEARKEAKLTQAGAAKLLKISRAGYRKWESGEENPTLESLNKLAEIFNCKYVGQFVPLDKP